MDTKETGIEGLALRQVPNRRHQLEKSLGLLLMLFGASTVNLTMVGSSPKYECELLGFTLLLFGFMALILSEFRNLGPEELLRRYGLILMLFGASIFMLTTVNACSAHNPEHVLHGFALFLLGFVLVALSELCGLGAGDLDECFGHH